MTAAGPHVASVESIAPVEGSAEARHVAGLAQLLRGEVRCAKHDRMLYATDAGLYQVEPLGVVIPADLDDVRRTVTYCRDHRLPMLPRGAGTSLAGQTVNRAVVIDMSVNCGRFLGLDEEQNRCEVEPGIVLDDLNEHLKAQTNGRLWFGPDVATSSHANLGGMIGNNSAGTHSILYGRTVENLAGVRLLTADGRELDLFEGAGEADDQVRDLTEKVASVIVPLKEKISTRFPRTRRNAGGYNLDLMLSQIQSSTPDTFDRVNLAHLICGAEGTLGIITAATLNLVVAPRQVGLAVLGFRSLDKALHAVERILRTKPSAVELLDELILELAERNRECRWFLRLLPDPGEEPFKAVLYVEYFGDTLKDVETSFRSLKRHVRGVALTLMTDPLEMRDVWQLRKAGEPLLHAIPGMRKPIGFVEDAAVAPGRLPEFIDKFRRIVEAHGTRASFYAHASVGCLHVRPLLNLREPTDRDAMESIAREVVDLVRSFGGAFSGEHGDGRSRSALLEQFYGSEIVDGFRQIKSLFDPEGLMNPGNIVDPVPITHHLRSRPAERTLPLAQVECYFDFGDAEGFHRAVELCNGAGVCRKKSRGTMCPSYMATNDERHSTRGRANALRLAISGQFDDSGHPQLNDPETLATLDLCLGCKACKAECPSNVDVARYKAEYLAQSYKTAGRIPAQARFFSQVDRISRIASLVWPLSNWIVRRQFLRRRLKRIFDIDPRRSLPEHQASLHRQLRRRSAIARPAGPTIILYADCFTAFSEPRVGIAAASVLGAFGYRVVVPRIPCCGRAAVSMGVLDSARQKADRAARALLRAVKRHNAVSIVVCEPSCLASIHDDWQALRLSIDEKHVSRLADLSRLPEAFLEERWEHHPYQPGFDGRALRKGRILLHAHCHQKALWGEQTSADIFVRLLGRAKVLTLDAGCCGMAGAFGMVGEHYDLSMKIAERRLLPAVRAMGDEDTLIAPGTSCRQQVLDGAGYRALHPIELVAQLLSNGSEN